MKKLLDELLHVDSSITLRIGKSGLPMHLTIGRSFYDVELLGAHFAVIEIKDTNITDIHKLKFGMIQYKNAFGVDVAYCFSDLSGKKRDALIREGIPFVALPGQVYLPFLGIVLQNKFPKEKKKDKRMSPLEQTLLLYLLYHDEEYSKAQLAVAMNSSRAAVTKVTSALEAKELISEKKVGKEVYVSIAGDRRHCFAKARKWMINPISKVRYCKNKDDCRRFAVAGESALSEMSMLSLPRNEVRACFEKASDLSEIVLLEDDRWENDSELIRLELWKYDPKLLGGGNMVDIISMALSLEDVNDERVQGELHDVLEEKGWL